MPKPLRIIIDFLSYEGSPTNNPQDAFAVKRKVEESDVEEVFRTQKQIAPSTVDETVELPDDPTEYLLIFTDRQITIKLNGSSDEITLSPKSAGVKCPVLFQRGEISALSISNAGTDAANVDIIAVNV